MRTRTHRVRVDLPHERGALATIAGIVGAVVTTVFAAVVVWSVRFFVLVPYWFLAPVLCAVIGGCARAVWFQPRAGMVAAFVLGVPMVVLFFMGGEPTPIDDFGGRVFFSMLLPFLATSVVAVLRYTSYRFRRRAELAHALARLGLALERQRRPKGETDRADETLVGWLMRASDAPPWQVSWHRQPDTMRERCVEENWNVQGWSIVTELGEIFALEADGFIPAPHQALALTGPGANQDPVELVANHGDKVQIEGLLIRYGPGEGYRSKPQADSGAGGACGSIAGRLRVRPLATVEYPPQISDMLAARRR